MKNLYLKGFVLLVCFYLFNHSHLYSQCLCTGGIPATAVTQSITISPTTASALNFTFQQFNPAIGNLSCVTLKDTILGSSISGAINTGDRGTPVGYTGPLPYAGPPVSSDSTIFKFLLALTNDVSGPGIDLSYDFSKTYGPDTLSYYGTPGDTVTYGPENIITNPTSIATTGGNAAYLGNGTVNFIYTINGGMVTTKGGSNYRSKVTTIFGGTLNLTYYWCPSVALGAEISNFSAYKKNGSISLQWLGTTDQPDITYEIDYSNDNEHWMAAGTVPAGSAPAGTVAQYQYQYNPGKADVGDIYFRIKRTDAQGNVFYSMIKVVNLQLEDQRPGMQIYPNPVNQKILVQFDEQQTGNYVLELVGTTGQVIARKQVQLSGTSITNMDLSNKPASGIYFLKAVNMANNRQFLTKVIVN
ncbi:MAG: T9SS type A sorting domain-containing protein [Puia sp.]